MSPAIAELLNEPDLILKVAAAKVVPVAAFFDEAANLAFPRAIL